MELELGLQPVTRQHQSTQDNVTLSNIHEPTLFKAQLPRQPYNTLTQIHSVVKIIYTSQSLKLSLWCPTQLPLSIGTNFWCTVLSIRIMDQTVPELQEQSLLGVSCFILV